MTLHAAVSIYLMSCYLYYELNESVLTDHEFDAICRRLYNEFENINHQHKHLLDKDSLRASTGYTLNDYPTIVKDAASRWLQKEHT